MAVSSVTLFSSLSSFPNSVVVGSASVPMTGTITNLGVVTLDCHFCCCLLLDVDVDVDVDVVDVVVMVVVVVVFHVYDHYCYY